MNKIYLLLGSNMGNSEQLLQEACNHIEKNIGLIDRKSHLYQTAAWGNTDQPDFLNQVIIVHSKLSALKTMEAILEIEKAMGRIRTEKNAPRIIDIDILFYANKIFHEPHLTVPHPALALRRFVLVPLVEISPSLLHPVLHKNKQELLAECPDKLDVKKI